MEHNHLDAISFIRLDVHITMGHTFVACSIQSTPSPRGILMKLWTLVVRGDWPRGSSYPDNCGIGYIIQDAVAYHLAILCSMISQICYFLVRPL